MGIMQEKVRELDNKRNAVNDLLKKSFKELRSNGIRAGINITKHCGDFHEESRGALRYIGSCCTEKIRFSVYNSIRVNCQENDIYIDFTGFGSINNNDTVGIGNIICKSLDSFGILWEWSGSESSCIKVLL